MLQRLVIKGVGPSDNVDLSFAKRVNIITGDNGMGKSFLLDVAWWALTRQWPQKVNPLVNSGRMASPPFGQSGEITVELSGRTRDAVEFTSDFDQKELRWILPPGRPTRQGLVVYAMVDGSFAVWDPARNYWRKQDEERKSAAPAYVFNTTEVWNGQERADGTKSCNGLLEDLVYWINEKGEALAQFKEAIESLAPKDESLTVGGVGYMMDDDERRYPFIKMPYKVNNDIPAVHLSAAIKRVIAIAYFLVWAWQAHKVACRKAGEAVTPDITIIIDEIEAHLHPKWQKNILKSLQDTVKKITECPNVQYIVSTHSPLVMASCEDFFSENDTWMDIDMKEGVVVARKKDFVKTGDATRWLLSEAFDMDSARSNTSQAELDAATQLMKGAFNAAEAEKMQARLESVLPSRDPFWLRWNIYLATNNVSL